MCTNQDLVPKLPSNAQSSFAFVSFPSPSASKNAVVIDAPTYTNPTLPHIIASHAQNRPNTSTQRFSSAEGIIVDRRPRSATSRQNSGTYHARSEAVERRTRASIEVRELVH